MTTPSSPISQPTSSSMAPPASSAALYAQLLQTLAPHYDAGEARAIARLYAEQAWGLSHTALLTDRAVALDAEARERFAQHLTLLSQGVPVQYVLGQAEFMGQNFAVSPAVLIPRPETEGLVQWAVERSGGTPTRLLDAGTGSGCIAVSLARQLPLAQVSAWDISPDALTVARHNAQQLGVQVHFKQQDILAQAQKPTLPAASIDVLVSNPPYIREKEMAEMDAHVVQHEPHIALFVPDYDPLLFYRSLAQLGLHLLTPQGNLMVECHRDCVLQVAQLFELLGYTRVEQRHDCFDQPRFVAAVKP